MNKGITLISLIITMIVIAILTITCIKCVFDYRIIDYAMNATGTYSSEQQKEGKELNK